MTNNFNTHTPRSTRPVTVSRHQVDWEGEDFDDVTGQRVLALDQRLSKGCWFLNPRYSVHAASPTSDFFSKVHEVQSSWIRTVRQTIHNRGLRQEARKREPLGRQLAFSGVMFIEGEIIPPLTWKKMADNLHKSRIPMINKTHRQVDLDDLKVTGNLDPLKRLALSALQTHLADQATNAAFIIPNLTISAPSATLDFYRKSENAKASWSILLKRTLGYQKVRQFHRLVDPLTYILVFGGVLFVDGKLYWPSCWPNQTPKPEILKRTPYKSPIIPPEFFGLELSTISRDYPLSGHQPSLAPKPTSDDPSPINDQFKDLMGPGEP